MATATDTQSLTAGQTELVAVGASVGAGCHPCVSHHLKAGADAGLEDEQLLAAVTSAERVTAEAAVLMADHVRSKLGPSVTAAAELSPLESALAALGAALGANDTSAIDLQIRTAHDFGASHSQLEQAIETAKTVQENAGRIHIREARRVLDSITTPTAADDDTTRDGACGCGSDDEARPASQPDETAGAQDGSEADTSSGAAGLRPPMAECLGSLGNGDGASPAAMIARCRDAFGRMFETSDAPEETKEPDAATAAKSCSDIREV